MTESSSATSSATRKHDDFALTCVNRRFRPTCTVEGHGPLTQVSAGWVCAKCNDRIRWGSEKDLAERLKEARRVRRNALARERRLASKLK